MNCRCGEKMKVILTRRETGSYWCPECGRVVKVFRETGEEEWYEPHHKPVEPEDVKPEVVVKPKEATATQPLKKIKEWHPPEE